MQSLYSQPIANIPIVVIDTEATGLYPSLGHRLVEIGAIRLENWRKVGEMRQLVNPKRPMSQAAVRVSGIQDADLVDAPPFRAVADDLLAFVQGAVCVAHKAVFDANLLAMELFIMGHPIASQKQRVILDHPWLCTLQLARRNFHFGRNNLANVARGLGVHMGKVHRALGDALTTAAIFKRMVRELGKQKFTTLEDFEFAQGGPIYAMAPPSVVLPSLIKEAMQKSRPLELLYLDKGKERRVPVVPLYPADHRGIPHLIAQNLQHNKPLPYRLDCIFSANFWIKRSRPKGFYVPLSRQIIVKPFGTSILTF